jgi:cytochrome c oxidase subunit 4
MTDHATSGHDAPHADHGSHGIAKYMYVFLALIVLTGASFFTYSDFWPYHNHPEIGWTFMMAVSCTKAMLVILFFMHLKYEADWKYVLTIPASIMSMLLVLALVPDVGMRFYKYSEQRKLRAAAVETSPHTEAAERLEGDAPESGHHE